MSAWKISLTKELNFIKFSSSILTALLAILLALLYLGSPYQFAFPVSIGNEDRGMNPDLVGQMNSAERIIPNQFVVTLHDGTSESAMRSLVDQVQNKGAHIVATYYQSLTGFSFVTPDAEMANEIVNFLSDKSQVESITPDRELSIQSSDSP